MGEEHKQSLLKKEFYENCPGCKVDRLKETQHGLPIKELVSIWIVVLCTALPISSLFPFLYFMNLSQLPAKLGLSGSGNDEQFPNRRIVKLSS